MQTKCKKIIFDHSDKKRWKYLVDNGKSRYFASCFTAAPKKPVGKMRPQVI